MVGKNFKSIINFFNIVYGGYIRTREIHFNTHIQAEHNLTNDLMPALIDYTDAVMENAIGMFGRPGMNIIVPVKCTEETLKGVLTHLRKEALKLKVSQSNEVFAGVNKILDDFIADLNKWIYLSENK